MSAFSAISSGLIFLASQAELSPTLQVLPINSTLSKITIPRFDENQNRVAYLKADLMEILADGAPIDGEQPIMVDCTGIQLRMATDMAGGTVSVDMEHARYRVTPGVLTVQETITARSPQFQVTGNGGVFHLDSQRGFLFGPLNCDIYSKATASHSIMLSPLYTLLAASSLLSLNPDHKPPTAEELLKVESLAKTSQPQIQASQKQTTQSVQKHASESKDADEKLQNFADDTDSKSLNLLIQNPPPAKPTGESRPLLKDPELSIHADAGCFFDGNENLLVFLRDVVVKEARFTLKAQEEIKVFFNAPPEEKSSKKDPKKGGSPNLSITDVKSLIATGGVNFSGIDKDGNPVEASAATAYYEDSDKVLILKGGQPTFWTKKGKLEIQLRAEVADASIRIELSGQSLVAHTSADGWQFGGKNLPLKEN